MKRVIFLYLFFCIGFLSFGQSSDSVSGGFIWLKPVVVSDSTTKLNVVNPVGSANLLNATTADFPRGFINFNPALRFEKDTAISDSSESENTPQYYYIVLDSLQSAGDMTLMIAYQSSETAKYGIWSIGDTREKMFLSSRSVIMGGMTLAYCAANYLFPVVNSLYQPLGSAVGTKGNDTTNIILADTLFMGKGNDLNYVGNLAEVIVFFKRLEQPVRNKWQSYLYMKYGVTISEDHYFNSDNDTLWNTKIDSLYSFGVAAIGFDSVTTLAQKQSQIFEDKVVLFLGNEEAESNILNTNTLPDNSFIFWGHNDSEGEFWGEEHLVDTTTYMLSDRKWKVKTHNLITNPQTTLTYQYNTDYLPERIVMLIDRTNEFVSTNDTTNDGYFANNELDFSASQMLFPDTIIDGKLYFKNINWVISQSNNDVIFSFAYKTYPSDITTTDKSSVIANNNSNGEDYFSLLPNPSTGAYNLHIELQKESVIEVNIVDAAGKMISKTHYPSEKIFDIGGKIKEKGSYFVNVKYGDRQKSLKLIINR